MDCQKPPKDNRLIQSYIKTWRDVYEPNGLIKQSIPSLKVCCECLVGHSIPVLRPSTFQWEFGNVYCYDECTEKHQFVFMDEDKEWVHVEDDPFGKYAQEFDEDAKPRSHGQGHHHHHQQQQQLPHTDDHVVNQSRLITVSRTKTTSKRPPSVLAPSIHFTTKVSTLDEDDVTVAVGRRKEDNNEVRTISCCRCDR
jgi:hypothetical protein